MREVVDTKTILDNRRERTFRLPAAFQARRKERALARFSKVLLTVSLTSACGRVACAMISPLSFVVTDADAFRDSVCGGVMQQHW